jgi:hypothetical protein
MFFGKEMSKPTSLEQIATLVDSQPPKQRDLGLIIQCVKLEETKDPEPVEVSPGDLGVSPGDLGVSPEDPDAGPGELTEVPSVEGGVENPGDLPLSLLQGPPPPSRVAPDAGPGELPEVPPVEGGAENPGDPPLSLLQGPLPPSSRVVQDERCGGPECCESKDV